MPRIDAFEVTIDDSGRTTFDLYAGDGEAREKVCEERIRDATIAQLWLALLTSPGEVDYDESFQSIRLVGQRPPRATPPPTSLEQAQPAAPRGSATAPQPAPTAAPSAASGPLTGPEAAPAA